MSNRKTLINNQTFVDRWNTIWWYLLSIGTRIILVFGPTINMIVLLGSEDNNLFIKIIFELLKLSIGLLLSFNIFVLPGMAQYYVPEKSIVVNQHRTYLMYLWVNIALYTRAILISFEAWLLQEKVQAMPWYLHIFGISSICITLILFYKRRSLIIKGDENAENYEALSIIGDASKKLNKYLSKEEINELENLLQLENELSTFSINSLMALIWKSILFALALAVLQELIGRIYSIAVK